MKTIGLVMAQPPGYSETFLNLKIKGLQNQGFRIIVFTCAKSNGNYYFEHKKAYPTEINDIIRKPGTIISFIYTLVIKSLIPAIRLYKLEKKNDCSTLQSLKSIYFNLHILPYKLDWLHFEFVTMALYRENTAKAIGAKMSVSVRGYDIGIYPLKHPGCYNKIWLKIDKLHTISNDLYKLCLDNDLDKQVPYKKITPAVNIDKIDFEKDNSNLQVPLKILTVARLNWIKGLNYSIETMKLLKENKTNFKYHIIGAGNQFESLVFLINQLGLEEHVFLDGKLSHEAVLEHMKESDIYIQPSLQEGFCNSVLEAQATGLLCIVTNAEGLSENVLNDKTGWVVPKRDSKAIFKKIEEVINLPKETRKGILFNARQRIENEFKIEKQISEFVEFFS